MKATQFINIASLLAALPISILAAPSQGVDVLTRQNSGCYPFEDPDCCIDYAVCQCANGDFYEFNESENGCNPPWGYLTYTENLLGGYCC